MKVTVELNSTYLNGKNLDHAISKKIEREVVNEIWKKVKDQVDKEVQKVAEVYVQEQLNEQIISYAKTIIKTEKIKAPRYWGGDEDMVSVEEFVKHYLDKQTKSDKVDKAVKEFAEQFTKKLRDRYDMEFASQIINKMRKQDLLKPEVETALFETKMKQDSDE